MVQAPLPKIVPKPTGADNIIEALGFVALVFLWVFTVYSYVSLPHTIPSHYNFKGQIDGYGSKNSLWFLPIISTIIFVGFTFLNKYPYIFDYPTAITAENAERQYTLATRLIRSLKLVVCLVFSGLTVEIVNDAKKQSSSAPVWTMLGFMLIVFLPIGIYLYYAFRKKEK